jgi:uncharacterized delta-60 repeat protein
MLKSGTHLFVGSRAILACVISLATLASGVGAVAASSSQHPGSLDPSFGDGGTVTTDLGNREAVRSVLAMEDGIVVATAFRHGSALVRYLPDGSLDAGFGTGGIETVVGADFIDVLGGPDGTLLVLGPTVLERRSRSGALDGTFGVGGRADFGPDAFGSSMAVLPDGGIVVVGTASSSSGFDDISVFKLTAGGSFDAGFGDAGRVSMDLGTLNDTGTGIASLPDGRILLLASRTSTPGGECCRNSTALIRLDPDGSLDATFGEDGIVTFRVTSHNGEGWEPLAMRVTGDGNILALMGQGAYGCPTSGGGFAYVVRRHADGTLDRTFGRGGHVAVPLIDPFTGNIALQSDGGILVGGETCATGDGPPTFGMVRLRPGGVLDRGFGVDGLVSTPLGRRGSLGTAIALQSDGKIVLAGVILGGAFGSSGTETAVARYRG